MSEIPGLPGPDLSAAVTRAMRAPSVYNTQPWRFRITPEAVELYADRDRQLDATDPDGRDIVQSCGAALHHLQVVLAAAGTAVRVERLPDPEDRLLLARIRPTTGAVDAAAAALEPAIDMRRTDRRRMSHTPVSTAGIRALVDAAAALGVLLVAVEGRAQSLLSDVLEDAARRQASVPGYAAELRMWTGRYAGSHDGVPIGSIAAVAAGLLTREPAQRFPHGTLSQPRDPAGPRSAIDAATLLVLATTGDGVLDQLRAGEATSAVLLTATRLGLATTPLGRGIEGAVTREMIRSSVLRVPEYPQLLLRVGLPASTAADLPATPRRPLRSVLVGRKGVQDQ